MKSSAICLAAKQAIEQLNLHAPSSKKENPLRDYILEYTIKSDDWQPVNTVLGHINTVFDDLMDYWTNGWGTSKYIKAFKWCPQLFADVACHVAINNQCQLGSFPDNQSFSAKGFVIIVKESLCELLKTILDETMTDTEFKELLSKILFSKSFPKEMEFQFNKVLSDLHYPCSIVDI